MARSGKKNARKVARQLFGAINYLHEDLGVMHRDLKLENVMFANKDRSSFEIRVVDFGLACVDEVAYDPVGSLQYMAPEISLSRVVGYTCAVDYWSLGIVLHGILMGFLPYHYEDLREMEEFARGEPAAVPLFGYETDVEISEDAKDLIRKLLVINPGQRMSTRDACNHRWLQQDMDEAGGNNVEKTRCSNKSSEQDKSSSCRESKHKRRTSYELDSTPTKRGRVGVYEFSPTSTMDIFATNSGEIPMLELPPSAIY